jgi:hypothetical protein
MRELRRGHDSHIHSEEEHPLPLLRLREAHQRGWNKCETRSVSAPELEGAVTNSLRNFAQDPAVLSDVLRRIEEDRQPGEPMAEPTQVQQALLKFDPLWSQLTTWEQETFIRTLVAHVHGYRRLPFRKPSREIGAVLAQTQTSALGTLQFGTFRVSEHLNSQVEDVAPTVRSINIHQSQSVYGTERQLTKNDQTELF